MARTIPLAIVALILSLVTDTYSQDSGCGTPMYQTGTSGNLSSMNYPNNYRQHATCEWRITAPVGYRIHIHFNENFGVLGDNTDCWKAKVMFEQPYTNDPLKYYAGPYCDWRAPPLNFFTLYNTITVKFKTTSGQSTGFSITWTIFSATMESGCGGPMYLFGESGSISSMNYPKQYHRWASCRWYITAPVGNRVKLQFNSTFNLEIKNDGSCPDYVINTGTAGLSCGTSAPSDVISSTNEATVYFYSDSSNQYTGFSLTWTAVAASQGGCGNSIQTGSSGSFNSMNYPNSYSANANCVWRISVTDGYRVRLHFNEPFNLKTNYDKVTIYEESSASFTYGPYSGSTAPSDILSYDSDVTVTFTSNAGVEYKGFKITWTATTKDIKTFGPNNEYTCHCNLNAQCDSKGACPNQECDQGWYGEYCQTGNAAIGRPAVQSSTYDTNTAAGKAVDNDRDQLMSGGSCTLTAELPLDDQPWWRVDLGRQFALLNLTIYNRGNDGCQSDASCRDRLKNFVVWMTDVAGPDSTKGNVCVTHPGTVALAAKQQLSCDPPAVGRYLYIKLLDTSTALSLCEVAIHDFQYRDCTGQHYGPNCNHRCRCADRSEQCNSASGACVSKCADDYSGKYCETLMPFMKQPPISTAQTGSSIMVRIPSWSKQTDGGDGVVLNYRLQYKTQSDSQWTNFTTEYSASAIASSSWNVTGLSNHNTIHQFRVVLFNQRSHEKDETWGRPGEARTVCPVVVTPKIKTITTGINSSKPWPNRAYLRFEIENFVDAGMPVSCFNSYMVHYNDAGSEFKLSVIQYQHTVNGLHPFTSYNVYMKLVDMDGKSARSTTSNKKTAEDTPGKVTSLAATQQDKTLRVTWSEPTRKNGVITAYLVEQKLAGYGQCQNVSGAAVSSSALPATSRSYVLPKDVMCPYCRYNITVIAATSAGKGNPLTLNNQITAVAAPTVAPPMPVLEEKTPTKITLGWTAMPCKDRNGPNGKYFYQLVGTSGTITNSGNTSDLKFYFHNLPAYTSYRFKIAYKNSAGVGNNSEVAFTTPEEASGTVDSISVKTSATTLKVKWLPPTSPNGVITSYKVGYKHLGYGPVGQCPLTASWVYKTTSGPVLEYTLATCPYCVYDVEVAAINGAGVGLGRISRGHLTTASQPTAPPPTPTISNTFSREVTFTWAAMPCENRNGPLVSYNYRLIEKSSGKENKSNEITSQTTVTLSALTPYTSYDFQVRFRNSVGLGPYTGLVTVTTEEEVPRAPSIEKAGSSLKSISVRVIPPKPPHGNILQYTIELWQTEDKADNSVVNITSGSVDLTHMFYLTTDTIYTFRAKGWTSKGSGAWSKEIRIRTIEGIPGPPNSIDIIDATVSSLKFRWTKPRFPNGVLKAYKLSCTPIFSYDNNINDNKDTHTVESEPAPGSTETNLEGLKQATEYNCSLSAQTSVEYGPAISAKNWTRPERDIVPTEWVSSVTIKEWSATTITLDIKEVPQKVIRSGKVKAVRVGVKMTSAKNLRKRATALTADEHEQLTGYEEAKTNGHTSYIAAELAVDFKGAFVIGDGTAYGGYQNPPLASGETYDVLYGIVTTAGGFISVSFSQLDKAVKFEAPVNLGVAVGIPIAILIILVAVIVPVVLLIRRRKEERSDQTYDRPIPMEGVLRVKDPDADIYDELYSEKPDEPTYVNVGIRLVEQPIYAEASRGVSTVVHEEDYANAMSLEDGAYDNPDFDLSKHAMFVDRLVQLITNNDLPKEFKDIPMVNKTAPMIIGGKGKWKAAGITPFEFNRVKMLIGEESKDINASYIQAFDSKTGYIAAKDPNPELHNEMWEMIWQNQCTAVVMLTTPAEDKAKRQCYWPSEGMKPYGDIKVTLIDKEEVHGCVVRTFKLDKKEQRQIVLQFQIMKWPDTTRKTDVIRGIVKRVSRHFEAGPLLVHCCDGSDRTGTFIALDHLIKQGEATGRVSVVDCIKKLREQRMMMVNSLANYKLIHDALVEHFLVGLTATSVKPSDFAEQFTKLKTHSRFEQLHQTLGYYDPPISPNSFATANAKININKNRDKAILPDDRHRVKLTSKSESGNDYINAVSVPGCNDQRYIVTQMPLPDTVNDFWRLVYDANVTTVVMLNQVDRKDETSAVYWQPKGEIQKYEQFTVECIKASADDPDISIRDFKVFDKLSKKETKVRQFQLLAWTDNTPLPPKPSVILKMTKKVDEWAFGSNRGNILVHCMNGATRSGLFCVAHSAISQVRLADEVDIFDLASEARAARPQILQELSQYEFVYELVAEYLKNCSS